MSFNRVAYIFLHTLGYVAHYYNWKFTDNNIWRENTKTETRVIISKPFWQTYRKSNEHSFLAQETIISNHLTPTQNPNPVDSSDPIATCVRLPLTRYFFSTLRGWQRSTLRRGFVLRSTDRLEHRPLQQHHLSFRKVFDWFKMGKYIQVRYRQWRPPSPSSVGK